MDVATGKAADERHAHCWGYIFYAIYTGYLLTGDERYRQAVQRSMDSVCRRTDSLVDEQGAGRKWGAKADSDSIEGALVLLNRIPRHGLAQAQVPPDRVEPGNNPSRRFLPEFSDDSIEKAPRADPR